MAEKVAWVPSTPAKSPPIPYTATEGLNRDTENRQFSPILGKMVSGFEFGNFDLATQNRGGSTDAERAGSCSEVVSPKTGFMVSENAGSGSKGTKAEFAETTRKEVNAKEFRSESTKASRHLTSGKRSTKRADLNEQPRKKMRMKKHRPKIYDETKPVKISVSKRRKSLKPRNPRTNFTPKPKTPGPSTPTRQTPGHVNIDKLRIPTESVEDVWSSDRGKISSRRKLDFCLENCIVDHNSTESNRIENNPDVELKNDGLDIQVHSLQDASCCDHGGTTSCINLKACSGIENKLEVELKNDGLDLTHAGCCDHDGSSGNQNPDVSMGNYTMDQNSKVCGRIENKLAVEFSMGNCVVDQNSKACGGIRNKPLYSGDRFRGIKVYQRKCRTRSCNMGQNSKACNGMENTSEVDDPKTYHENSGVIFYRRKFKKRSCNLYKNSKECGGIDNKPEVEPKVHSDSRFRCSEVYLDNPPLPKGKRMRQQKATVFNKLNEFVGKVFRAQRRMKKPMDSYFGEDNLKKMPREAVEHSTFDRCALNWTWIASSKRKRSWKTTCRRNISFGIASTMVNLKKKRSKTSFRRRNYSVLINYFSKIQGSKAFPRKASISSRTQKKVVKLKSRVGGPQHKPKAFLPNQDRKDGNHSIFAVKTCLIDSYQIAQGALVTSKEKLGPTKKRKELPKVDIDSETIRVWNLLMESDKSWNLLMENVWGENNEQKEDDREKYWSKQKEIFSGRVESFIARMHLIQGDRRFSQWKGSVVDSVVGVFLTQNVSDHLSSSAFMNLAAKYPPLYSSKDDDCNDKTKEEKLADLQLACEELFMMEKYLSSTPSKEVEVGYEVEAVNKISFQVQSETEKSKENVGEKQENKINWDDLRKKSSYGRSRKRTNDSLDSVNWEAVRKAPVEELAKVIMERGMNNVLAQRIKDFLDRLVRDHGSIDLEWLRDVPQDKAKDYLLSITGLGLKSVECVRLLTLRHHAFPVDTNVARILVRLGWVPLLPLPGDIQIHLLNDYPPMDAIQKYIWPRLCFLSKLILYELHYQMITFGKLFCTKKLPNCNACPMRGECRHFASAYASFKLKLKSPEDKNMATESSGAPNHESSSAPSHDSSSAPSREFFYSSGAPGHEFSGALYHELMKGKNPQMISEFHHDQSEGTHQCCSSNCDPIIELPASPEPIHTEMVERDIEDIGYASGEEIPTIKLNSEELRSFFGEEGVSKALTALCSESSSIPTPKLKYVGRLRTVHHVYVLHDSHPLLVGYEKREADDMCPYLLAIWTSGDLMNSFQDSRKGCNSQGLAPYCSGEIVSSENDKFVRGTILIPCRTANRGSFPLNGTYFQVNEVFADQESSRNPIMIPRELLWNLPRGTLYCGTSATSICRGMSMEEVIYTFWKGFICVRGFDRSHRAPRPLSKRFHLCKTRKVDDDDV